MDAKDTYQAVQDHYGSLARAKSSATYGTTVAKAFGYSDDELTSIPKDANLGLSCGNPLALASVREVSDITPVSKLNTSLTHTRRERQSSISEAVPDSTSSWQARKSGPMAAPSA